MTDVNLGLERYFEKLIKDYYSKKNRLPKLSTLVDNEDDIYIEDEEYINTVYKPIYEKIISTYQERKTFKPRNYQNEIINTVLDEYKKEDRVGIKAPTGSGKTKMAFITMANMITCMKPKVFVFVSPLLKINKQCLKDTYILKLPEFNKSNNKNKFEDIEVNSKNNKYLNRIRFAQTNNCNIILSTTYKSLHKIFEIKNIIIDMLVLDECHMIPSYVHKETYFHNLELQENSSDINIEEMEELKKNNMMLKKKEWFDLFHSERVLKRLFISATPYNYQENDKEKYGSFIEKVKVGYLIKQGYLSKVQTYISKVKDRYNEETPGENNDRPDTAKSIINFIIKTNSYRMCIFVNNTKNAEILKNSIINLNEFKTFKDTTGLTILEPILYVGKSNEKELEKFSNNETPDNFNDKEVRIIISCKKLSMGVDIPCIDSVSFADPRMNKADISQCIGRGLRYFKIKNKTKVCSVLLIDYATRDDKNKMIYAYLEYLKDSEIIYKIERKIKKGSVSPNNKKNCQCENNSKDCCNCKLRLLEINKYDGNLEVECEYYENYSSYIKDINSKKSMNLDNFVKLLEDNNIKHPEYDEEKYRKLQDEWVLPNIEDIRSKYPKFGWELCNKNHECYKTIIECNTHIDKIKHNCLKEIGYKTWKYMSNKKKYNIMLQKEKKLPNIYYEEFYIPAIYLDEQNISPQQNTLQQHTEIININIDNFKKYNYDNSKIVECKINNKMIGIQFNKIIEEITSNLDIQNEKYDDFKSKIESLSSNLEYVEIIIELCDINDLNIDLTIELNNKKIVKYENMN